MPAREEWTEMTDTRTAVNTFAGGNMVAFVSPLGTAPPTAFETLAAPWINLGWLDVSGINFKLAETLKDVMAAGTLDPIRTITSEAIKTVDITFLEALNPAVRALYDDVDMSLLEPSSGTVASYLLPEVPSNNENCFVFDSFDGDKMLRTFAVRGRVTTRGGDQQQQSDAETLAMTFTFYPDLILGVTGTVKRYIDYGAESDLTPFF
jgi:hypothetical protein